MIHTRATLLPPFFGLALTACSGALAPAALKPPSLELPATASASAARPRALASPRETAATASQCDRKSPGVGAVAHGIAVASSTVALASKDGDVVAYVADADGASLFTVDLATGRRIAETPLDGSPEHALVLADGRVAVTLRQANALQILEPTERLDAPLRPRCRLEQLPSEPIAMATTPDGKTLLVTSGWGRALVALDARSLAPRFEVPLAREPRAVVVSDDGQRAFVAHVVGAKMTVVDLAAAAHGSRVLDLGTRVAPRGSRALVEAPRKGCQGFALTKAAFIPDPPVEPEQDEPSRPDAAPAKRPALPGRIFAPMVTVEPDGAIDPSRSQGYYGDPSAEVPIELSQVPVVDERSEGVLTRAVLALPRDPERKEARSAAATARLDCNLPRAAALSGKALYVTCLGIDALVELDATAVDPARAELRRWKVPEGPTGIAVDAANASAVVWSQFEHTATIVPLGDGGAPRRVDLATSGAGPTRDVALGRRLFHRAHDPRIASDGRACASCHPEGRDDAISWATPTGPRQTPMLAGRVADTAPFGWLGAHATLDVHVKDTFRRLGGTGLPEKDRRALVSYLEAMPPPHGSRSRDPARRQLVDQGRALFSASGAGCASCHIPTTGLTDHATHEVGPSHRAAKGARTTVLPGGRFKTPSLRFVAGTAPFFHDARFETLDALLAAPEHVSGVHFRLSPEQRAALKAYVEEL